jgi:hypothetical protein
MTAPVPADLVAVDWSALPGPPGVYRPELVEPNLRALESARGSVEAARAASGLADGGLLHDHSGVVLPAAAAAAPRLAAVVADGHPAARAAAVRLLDAALQFWPADGFGRLATADGHLLPLCSLLAREVRHAHRQLGSAAGFRPELVCAAAEHWVFHVQEAVADNNDTIAWGVLDGTAAEHTPQPVERHGPAGRIADAVALVETGDGVRVRDCPPEALPSGSVLVPADCGWHHR